MPNVLVRAKGSTSMTISKRFNIAVVVAGAGMCAAVTLSPVASAASFLTGGYECLQTSAGEAPAVLPAAAPCAAPLSSMAGVPMALPGPVPVAPPVAPPIPVAPPLVPPVPLAPPVPVVPPLVPPLGAPIAAGAPVAGAPIGAPLVEMAGTGKGAPTGPAPAGAPASGQPILPGPTG